jgi:hypothetical protein
MLLAVKNVFTECGFSQGFIVDIHCGVFWIFVPCGRSFKDGGMYTSKMLATLPTSTHCEDTKAEPMSRVEFIFFISPNPS